VRGSVAVPEPVAAPCTPRVRLVAVNLQRAVQLDGDLEEWPRPSRFAPNAEPCMLELEVALHDEGLFLAGQQGADAQPFLLAPRLELEVAFGFPALVFGVPRFANHLEVREIGSAADCADAEAVNMPNTPQAIASCEQWLESARAAQARLAKELVQKLSVGAVLAAGGRSFEAFVPNSALPPVPGYPVHELWLRGLLSPGNIAIETPTRPDACEGCPEPFRGHAALQLGNSPEAAEAVESGGPLPPAIGPRPRSWVEGLTGELIVYRLGPKLEEVQVHDVPLRAYQYAPELPFPTSRPIRLRDAEAVASLGEIRVLLLEAGNMVGSSTPQVLLTLRGEEIVDALQVSDLALKGSVQGSSSDAAPELHLLSVAETSQSKLGSGTCGACSVLGVTEVVVRDDGRVEEPTLLFGLHELETENRWEVRVASDARSVHIEFVELDPGALPRARQHRVTLQWDPKHSKFVKRETLGRWRPR